MSFIIANIQKFSIDLIHQMHIYVLNLFGGSIHQMYIAEIIINFFKGLETRYIFLLLTLSRVLNTTCPYLTCSVVLDTRFAFLYLTCSMVLDIICTSILFIFTASIHQMCTYLLNLRSGYRHQIYNSVFT